MNELEKMKQEERQERIIILRRIALTVGSWVLIVLIFMGIMLLLAGCNPYQDLYPSQPATETASRATMVTSGVTNQNLTHNL